MTTTSGEMHHKGCLVKSPPPAAVILEAVINVNDLHFSLLLSRRGCALAGRDDQDSLLLLTDC